MHPVCESERGVFDGCQLSLHLRDFRSESTELIRSGLGSGLLEVAVEFRDAWYDDGRRSVAGGFGMLAGSDQSLPVSKALRECNCEVTLNVYSTNASSRTAGGIALVREWSLSASHHGLLANGVSQRQESKHGTVGVKVPATRFIPAFALLQLDFPLRSSIYWCRTSCPLSSILRIDTRTVASIAVHHHCCFQAIGGIDTRSVPAAKLHDQPINPSSQCRRHGPREQSRGPRSPHERHTIAARAAGVRLQG